jgi:HSP20 family protein
MDQRLPIHRGSSGQMPSMFSPFGMSPFWWDDDSFLSVTQRNMSRMFEDAFDNMRLASPLMGASLMGTRRMPQPEITEDRKGFHLKMAVPGLEADDIDISTEDGMLTISAEKQEKKGGVDSSYSFSQSMRLPEGADIDRADVTLNNHVLSIEIPKSNGNGQKMQIRSQRGEQKQGQSQKNAQQQQQKNS